MTKADVLKNQSAVGERAERKGCLHSSPGADVINLQDYRPAKGGWTPDELGQLRRGYEALAVRQWCADYAIFETDQGDPVFAFIGSDGFAFLLISRTQDPGTARRVYLASNRNGKVEGRGADLPHMIDQRIFAAPSRQRETI